MSLLFVFLSCAWSQHPPAVPGNLYFYGTVDRDVSIYAFDGFRLRPVENRDGHFNEKIPVSRGEYFALFLTAKGYLPLAKAIRAGTSKVKLGKLKLKKSSHKGTGYLVGVVYKPVRGGKIVYRKGIHRLLSHVIVKALDFRGNTYTATTGENGIFVMPLPKGKYRVFLDDSPKGSDIVIENGKTTIHNIRKGLVLLD